MVDYFVATRVLIGSQKARGIGILLSLAWLATLSYLIKQRDSILTPETLGLLLAAGSLAILASRRTNKWCRLAASIRRQSVKPASAKGGDATKPTIMRRTIRPAALVFAFLLLLAVPGVIYLHEKVQVTNIITVAEKVIDAQEAAKKHPDAKDVSRYAEALRSARELLGTDHSYTCVITFDMAEYCVSRGMGTRAEELSQELMTIISSKKYTSDGVEYALIGAADSLGRSFLVARRYEIAESMLSFSVDHDYVVTLQPFAIELPKNCVFRPFCRFCDSRGTRPRPSAVGTPKC